MIYFCADDYGLCDSTSVHIQQCVDDGVLNKVSIFPNFEKIDVQRILQKKNVRLSLHLNLVEGKCMANPEEITLIADKNGNFKHRFGGLFKLWLCHPEKLEAQVYKEIKAQILFWKNSLPEDVSFCVDSHQHTHMIPAVFRALVQVLKEEAIDLEYMRIPAEPVMPYLKTPSLYGTYKPVNMIKQWLLKCLWFWNRKQAKKYNLPTAYFMGILFSGKMDETRVKKILPKYQKLAEKNNKDIEVLFHPGYWNTQNLNLQNQNIVFQTFYLSKDRKTEFDSVMKLSERSVQ
ncbi:MAG: ChbG/HpnK family deacetylase [Clostridia bacterium]|nr:ChbG/HpnK family deacetylase [Clostridia bacterium]